MFTSIRDAVLTLIIIGALPCCFKRPYIGVLFWSWISFMAPHRLTWGFAYDLPFAQIVAVPTMMGFFLTKERRPIPRFAETALLAAFWSLTFVTTAFAWYPDEAWSAFEQFSKIIFMIFVTIALVQDRVKLRYLLMVEALSIGFYGLKGGVWSLATGGASGMVLGPEESFIRDNNSLALALNMTLPILFFLAREEQRIWLRKILRTIFFLTILAVIFTYSRGGFLGLAVVLLGLVARSRLKIYAFALVFVGAIAVSSFVPERWVNRMSTISNYEEDRSAMSRIYAWKLGWRVALESPLVGGGFNVFGHDEIWAKYAPEFYFEIGKDATNRTPNAHSIYFHVLGEHGFAGFLIFIGLIAATLSSLRKTRRHAKSLPDASWLVNYSYMVETSIFAFLATGAFVNLTYFDLFYFLVGVSIVLRQLAKAAVPDGNLSPVGSLVAHQQAQFRCIAGAK
jgi:putative inorganic carbon (HCO3(-)) transporter